MEYVDTYLKRADLVPDGVEAVVLDHFGALRLLAIARDAVDRHHHIRVDDFSLLGPSRLGQLSTTHDLHSRNSPPIFGGTQPPTFDKYRELICIRREKENGVVTWTPPHTSQESSLALRISFSIFGKKQNGPTSIAGKQSKDKSTVHSFTMWVLGCFYMTSPGHTTITP